VGSNVITLSLHVAIATLADLEGSKVVFLADRVLASAT
jgi:hypothetical protein